MVCSSIFAFHYSYFPPTGGKGVLKERNESIDSDDYKEKSFSELYFFAVASWVWQVKATQRFVSNAVLQEPEARASSTGGCRA